MVESSQIDAFASELHNYDQEINPTLEDLVELIMIQSEKQILSWQSRRGKAKRKKKNKKTLIGLVWCYSSLSKQS